MATLAAAPVPASTSKSGGGEVWLEAPASATGGSRDPESAAYLTDVGVPGLAGCAGDPCRLGWVPSDIRAVANTAFLDANPAVRRLLEQVEIPLADILAQNALMVADEGDYSDIVAHAQAWIADNETLVAGWLDAADPDAVAYYPDGESAGNGPRVLRAAVRVLAPFVTYADRQFGGFEAELAARLADRMGMTAQLYGVDTVAKQIDDLDRQAADVAMGGVEITKSRETQADFSLPVLTTGLRVMVPAVEQSGLRGQVGVFLRAIADSDLPWLLAVFGLAVLLAAHLIWWLERRGNPDFARPYTVGIWDSFYWSVVTMSTVGYGDKVPKAHTGRAFSLLWIIFGTLLFAALTASIASSLAVSKLTQDISGPSDLHGRRVATLADTSGETFLNSAGIGPVLASDIDDAYRMLEDGDVNAVVFDAPVLDFHAAHTGAGKLVTVGPIFDTVSYGIAIAQDNPALREQINRTMLDMIESGEYERLQEKWFGGP